MKLLLIVCAVAIGGALGKPTGEPQAAEVIQVVDEKTPIVLTTDNDAENALVQPKSNETAAAVVESSGPPTPVPDNVALTTEKVPENTPALVPSVVEISTVAPSGPPAPAALPSNSTSTDNNEDEDDSDENEASNEEEEEEDEEEEDEEEDEADDEEDEADEEEDEEEDDASAKSAKSKKPVKKTRSGREEIVSSYKEGETDKSEEEPAVAAASAPVALNKLSQGSKLQGVDGKTPTNEDDEAESVLISVGGKPSIII